MNRTLLSFRGFKSTGVTVDDINANNEKAQEAIQAMGQLPELILSGEYKPELLPTPSKVKIMGFRSKNVTQPNKS